MKFSRRQILAAPLALGTAVWPLRTFAQPLWPGALNTEADRARAIERGLRFVYATARVPRNFAAHGDDYLWCFHTIAATSADPKLAAMARRMGEERARAWRHLHPKVPPNADVEDLSSLAFGSHAADQLGLRDARMREQLERAAARFGPIDFLSFDPGRETPPEDVPDT
jgi:hypothetical protein